MSNGKNIEMETTRAAKLIEVIETVSLRGSGTNTPIRNVTQYWSKEGKLLAENDPCSRDDAK